MMRLVREGVPPAQIGLVSTAAGIGGILGALLAPYLIRPDADRHADRPGRLDVLPAARAPRLGGRPVGRLRQPVFLLLLNPAGNAGIGSYRAAITPDDLQGRVGSASHSSRWRCLPLAPAARRLAARAPGGTTAIAVMVVASGPDRADHLEPVDGSVPRPSEWVVEEPVVEAVCRLAHACEAGGHLGDLLGQLGRRLHHEVRARAGQHHHRPAPGRRRSSRARSPRRPGWRCPSGRPASRGHRRASPPARVRRSAGASAGFPAARRRARPPRAARAAGTAAGRRRVG